jgi:hypothetical protein
MKAIVVVFFLRRKPETPERQLSLRETRTLAAPANAGGNAWTPPFWTWFIENPRRVQSNDIAL